MLCRVLRRAVLAYSLAKRSNSLCLPGMPSVLQTASDSYAIFPSASPPEPWRVVPGQRGADHHLCESTKQKSESKCRAANKSALRMVLTARLAPIGIDH